MKTLIMVRHGKSSWEYNVDDRDRPLKQRGINDAHLVGTHFKKHISDLDAAYSSPACRALHTAMIVLKEFAYPLDKFRVVEELYDFSALPVTHFVRGLDDQLDKVIIFGHNYAFTNVANQWGNQHIDNVPTSGLVQISFDSDSWASINDGKTDHILFPKQLK